MICAARAAGALLLVLVQRDRGKILGLLRVMVFLSWIAPHSGHLCFAMVSSQVNVRPAVMSAVPTARTSPTTT